MNTIEPNRDRQNTRYLVFLTAVASLGGFLFGYDTAVISGTTDFLQERFQLTDLELGWAAASALVGCIIGSAGAGYFSDRFGRRKALLLAAIFYTVSALGSAIPMNLTQLSLARIIGGIGVGAASAAAPCPWPSSSSGSLTSGSPSYSPSCSKPCAKTSSGSTPRSASSPSSSSGASSPKPKENPSNKSNTNSWASNR